MKEKASSSVSIIGGADGPTSYFIVGGRQKKSVKQKMQKWIFDIRKRMAAGNIKAAPHSIREVEKYIIDVCGFMELNPDMAEYQREYIQMRASFVMIYAPELLGTIASYPELAGRDMEAIKKFEEQLELRQKAAENIPKELFDIDLHIFEKEEADLHIWLIVEGRYGYIGGSASGSKQKMKKYNKIYRDVYRYYGVAQEDIDQKTKRYEEVIKVLARR